MISPRSQVLFFVSLVAAATLGSTAFAGANGGNGGYGGYFGYIYQVLFNREKVCNEVRSAFLECNDVASKINDWHKQVEDDQVQHEKAKNWNAAAGICRTRYSRKNRGDKTALKKCLDGLGEEPADVLKKKAKKKGDDDEDDDEEASGDDDDEKLSKDEALRKWLAMKDQRAANGGTCPAHGPNDPLDGKAAEMLNSSLTKLSDWNTRMMSCYSHVVLKSFEQRETINHETGLNFYPTIEEQKNPLLGCVDWVKKRVQEYCFIKSIKVLRSAETGRVEPGVDISFPSNVPGSSK
jgi:hypothetical protein